MPEHTSFSLTKCAPGIRAKSASLPKPLVKVGYAAPDWMGIAAVFDEPKGNGRSDTYTHFPSGLHVSNGAEEREVSNPTLQLSHTVIGAPPSNGTAKDITFLSPCPPGAVTPTRAQRPSGETLCNCMVSRYETATWPLPSSLIFLARIDRHAQDR